MRQGRSPERSGLRTTIGILRQDKAALVGGVGVLVYCVVAAIGPVVVHLRAAVSSGAVYLPPSLRYPLGTDSLGQGVLTELIIGTRPIMEVGVTAAFMVVSVGVIVGLFAGYEGGWVDSVLMRMTDIALTIPSLPLIIVVAAVVHTSSPFALAAILSLTGWAGLARNVRSLALSLRSSDFVEVCRVQGLPRGNVLFRQLLPNIGPYVAVNFLLSVTGAIYAEVGLFVLGIAPISGTNWGIMLNLALSSGALYTSRSVAYLLSPMVAIVLLQVCLVFASRIVDMVFNPRLRVPVG